MQNLSIIFEVLVQMSYAYYKWQMIKRLNDIVSNLERTEEL